MCCLFHGKSLVCKVSLVCCQSRRDQMFIEHRIQITFSSCGAAQCAMTLGPHRTPPELLIFSTLQFYKHYAALRRSTTTLRKHQVKNLPGDNKFRGSSCSFTRFISSAA